jgi:hypothetical protein
VTDPLLLLRTDFPTYAAACLKIKDKDGGLVPLRLNSAQQHAHRLLEEQLARTGKVRAIILKGRQQGLSTYIEGRFYWKVSGSFGLSAMILTHKQEATDNLFGMATRYHEHCPPELKPSTKKANAKELYFDSLDSGYKVATAGGKGSGRGSTAQFFHASEMAFWPSVEENWAGIGQIIPNSPGTEVVIESTANGLGNRFHRMWQEATRGASEYLPIFIPWFWQDEYRLPVPADFTLSEEDHDYREAHGLDLQQMAWRRAKIADDFGGDADWFRQEYPATPEEAFVAVGSDSYIKPPDVQRAKPRPASPPEKFGARLTGCDPARFGDDATAIIRRQGRVAWGLERIYKADTMHIVGLLARLIADEKPDALFLDIGGLGAGIYDRLVELGHGRVVRPVNFGEQAYDQRRFANRRAEMWGGIRDWLKTPGGVLIPADDGLSADLIGPQYAYDSSSRVKLESKEAMRKRGIASPDGGDALALTFAEPVEPRGHDGRPVETWKDRLKSLSRPRRSGMAA